MILPHGVSGGFCRFHSEWIAIPSSKRRKSKAVEPNQPSSLDTSLSSARRGDKAAEDVVWKRLHDIAQLIASRRIGRGRRWVESGDIVQQACLKMMKWLKKSPDELTWNQLVRATVRCIENSIVDLLRLHGRDAGESNIPIGITEVGDRTDEVLLDSDRAWVREFVEALPEPYGIIVELRVQQKLTYKAIGEILQMPIGTVRDRYLAAQGSLEAALRRRGITLP